MGWKGRLRDAGLAAAVAAASIPMRLVRRHNLAAIPRTAAMLRRTGVFPIRDHYYEPLYDFRHLAGLDRARELPGIDLNLSGQTALLGSFGDMDGLAATANASPHPFAENPNFWAGDAELWFHVIRHFRPRRIIEVGSGHSTRMAFHALARNRRDDPAYSCEHVCIEPYEMPWLESLGVSVVRRRIEDVDLSMFAALQANDILFIDSSHMIRPQGDVLLEFLRIIPALAPGVIVHVHDIFTPRDYPAAWIAQPRFWNEQYLLEAFLSHNGAWDVLLAANFLKHECYDLLRQKCIWLTEDREPGSFYMRRR